ncbi:MAG: ABC transporter permease subunit [Streptosporangiales bacterium]|nr:ABC transporter permease subunit [Streptosporangiales bacterium]
MTATQVAPTDRVDTGGAAQKKTVRRRQRVVRRVIQLLLLAGFLAAWEGASRTVIEPYYISSPSKIAVRAVAMLADGALVTNALITLGSAVGGFLIGGVAAILIGYLLGVSPFWAAIVEPFITALWGMPRTAVIPLLVIWVGIGAPLAVVVAAILTFFLLFYNTYYGIRDVSQGLIDAVRVMGGNRLHVALWVRLPSAFVWIAAGMKMSLPMSLVGVVTAEMLASNRGLGHLVQFYGNSFDTTSTFVVLLALLVVGLVMERLVHVLNARALVWRSVSALDKDGPGA